MTDSIIVIDKGEVLAQEVLSLRPLVDGQKGAPLTATVHVGDVFDVLPTLPAESVNCVVTSPPYFGLRSYLAEDFSNKKAELGCETTLNAYVTNLVDVFREVRRVLRKDGVVWLVLGDSYGAGSKKSQVAQTINKGNTKDIPQNNRVQGFAKQLLGVPWKVAFALQADGWILRSDIIFAKTNCMPSSVKDRCTSSHEYIFMLTKSLKYYYNMDAIREPHSQVSINRVTKPFKLSSNVEGRAVNMSDMDTDMKRFLHPRGKNKRDVWALPSSQYKGAHFASFPAKLVEPCVLASCPEQVCSACGMPWVQTENYDWRTNCKCEALAIPGTTLDIFSGSGTTGSVACRLGRNYIGIELNPEYAQMSVKRICSGK